MMKKMMERFKVLPTMFVIRYLLGFFYSLVFCFGANNVSVHESGMETYIVHLKKPEAKESDDHDPLYGSFLPRHRIMHSYRHVMIGFAARLTATEAEEMEKKEGFVSIRPQRILSLQTTYTPAFLGLRDHEGDRKKFWELKTFGQRVIIGVLDTGITPNHPSFSGDKIGPPPEKWQGQCDFERTLCNNKLIGAKNMVDKSKPPFDEMGHGTHTASIAAGNFVKVPVSWAADGSAAGMAPRAHLAIYKVCSSLMICKESDVIAGIDAAIDDGVDIISLSIADTTPLPFDKDPLSIAAFKAVKKGILVACAAGNSGPISGTISNVSPWMLTVGAGTVDRTFPVTVFLGNGENVVGESFLQPKSFSNMYMSLVFAGKDGDEAAEYCRAGSLTDSKVKGKIVVCETGGELTGIVAKGIEVKASGGTAMILINSNEYEEKRADGLIMYNEVHVLPTLHLSYEAGSTIKSYITDSLEKNPPRAKILFEGTAFGSPNAPMVAEFSSRGPNPYSYEILKPNIIGPGVKILAAWLNTENNDIKQNPTFAMLSGTSMATAHISGIATLLKSYHPDWTPPIIMSAMMTTAYYKNLGNKPITNDQTTYRIGKKIEAAGMFDMGAGHVNPLRANDPGLVYDITIEENIDYLCTMGYSDIQIAKIVQEPISCSNRKPTHELNYPSFSMELGHLSKKVVERTVTNVGPRDATYSAHIVLPEGVDISLSTNKLKFREGVEKLRYTVTFRRQKDVVVSHPVEGHLSWVFNDYEVRSPIVITLVALVS